MSTRGHWMHRRSAVDFWQTELFPASILNVHACLEWPLLSRWISKVEQRRRLEIEIPLQMVWRRRLLWWASQLGAQVRTRTWRQTYLSNFCSLYIALGRSTCLVFLSWRTCQVSSWFFSARTAPPRRDGAINYNLRAHRRPNTLIKSATWPGQPHTRPDILFVWHLSFTIGYLFQGL